MLRKLKAYGPFHTILGATAAMMLCVTQVRADTSPPVFYSPFPYADQTVKSMDRNDSGPGAGDGVFGQLVDQDGINRCVVYIRRYGDGYYWSGSTWTSASTGLLCAILRYGSTNSYQYDYARGPGFAYIAAGVKYQITVRAVDRVGNVSSIVYDVNGAD